MKRGILLLSLLIALSSCDKENTDEPTPISEGDDFACGTDTAFTDPRDGQTYQIVQIGDQCWFAENLRYDPPNADQISVQGDWVAISADSTEQAAWCYYDNDESNDLFYGKLYNWFAVNTGTLCPDGWRIPSDQDWSKLEIAVGLPPSDSTSVGEHGISENVGGKLKSIEGWTAVNQGATDESGFTALPGGLREGSGLFFVINDSGYWWTTSERNNPNFAWGRILGYNFRGRYRNAFPKTAGFSCRCVKD